MIFWTIFPFSNIAYEPNATAHVSIYDQTCPISKGCRTPDFCLSKKSTLSVFVPLKKFRDSPVFWQLKSLKNKCPRNKCITKMWLKILVRTIACVLTWDAGEFNLDATKKKGKGQKGFTKSSILWKAPRLDTLWGLKKLVYYDSTRLCIFVYEF